VSPNATAKAASTSTSKWHSLNGSRIPRNKIKDTSLKRAVGSAIRGALLETKQGAIEGHIEGHIEDSIESFLLRPSAALGSS
jgi:hypothetical protein